MPERPQSTASRGKNDSWFGALVLATLLTPFAFILAATICWGCFVLMSSYVSALCLPAEHFEWWQWPWGWPGQRLVEAGCKWWGLAPLACHLASGPMALFDNSPVLDRVAFALLLNCAVAMIPLHILVFLVRGSVRVSKLLHKKHKERAAHG